MCRWKVLLYTLNEKPQAQAAVNRNGENLEITVRYVPTPFHLPKQKVVLKLNS